MSLEELRFSKDHEWAAIAEGVASIGITDYAQKQLGDVVFVELPAVGRNLAQGEAFGVVESVKAVSDLFSPLSGEVIEVNQSLVDSPQLINADPYHDGWMIKVRIAKADEIQGLMSSQDYERYLEREKRND
ncbi:MAG: glycine cleavage system protein GcvH [candidate division NC10 bacterium]|nr:glycine cleavage system protein GcvH [candidate division NC10 bacterium]